MQTINVLTKQNTFVVRTVQTTINILAKQKRGLPGKDGADGNALGFDKHYTQTFSDTATVAVSHNMEKYPSVFIKDSSGDEVQGDVEHIDQNNLIIRFSAPFSGEAVCN